MTFSFWEQIVYVLVSCHVVTVRDVVDEVREQSGVTNVGGAYAQTFKNPLLPSVLMSTFSALQNVVIYSSVTLPFALEFFFKSRSS